MGRFSPRERATFLAIKAACYRGLGPAELLAFLGERLTESLRADATCMVQLDPATALPTYYVSRGWEAGDARLVVEQALLVSPGADPGRLLAQGRRAVRLEELIDAPPLSREPYFACHLLPRGYRYEVQAACAIGRRAQALLTVTRRAATGAFEPRHLRLLDAVRPHVAAGLHAAGVRQVLAAPMATETGLIVLDEQGEVVLANAVGEHWLAIADPPGRPGRLWALHVLAGLLARSLEPEGAATVPVIEVADPTTGSLHRLRAERARQGDGAPRSVILLEPIRGPDTPETLLRLGLTAREAMVTLGVLRGASVEALAREAGVSPHTIAQHLRNVHTKLDVSSRRALMVRLYQRV
jgi:DNA-binding CsgD family transcriptional regulator